MRANGLPVGSVVGIQVLVGVLYKIMTSSSSSFDDNDDKVVVVGCVDPNAVRMSRRLKTRRTDFDQYIAQFKSPATRRKNNINNNNDAVIVHVNDESSVESMECNGIMETKLYRDLHTQ